MAEKNSSIDIKLGDFLLEEFNIWSELYLWVVYSDAHRKLKETHNYSNGYQKINPLLKEMKRKALNCTTTKTKLPSSNEPREKLIPLIRTNYLQPFNYTNLVWLFFPHVLRLMVTWRWGGRTLTISSVHKLVLWVATEQGFNYDRPRMEICTGKRVEVIWRKGGEQ